MSTKKPIQGEIVSSTVGPKMPLPFDALNALTTIVDSARECYVTHHQEATKRARIKTYETTEVARIRAAESVLKQYFEQAFAERRTIIGDLFDRLDRAMEADDGETVQGALRGIVDVARTSPLADLGDLGQIRKALDDPDLVWEL